MSNVTLTIAGRSYTVACAPGEEPHIEGLGRLIDGKLKQVPGVAGQSESRTLLFATLLLADELHEMGSARAKDQADADSRTDDSDAAETFEFLAERLENLADRLESSHADA